MHKKIANYHSLNVFLVCHALYNKEQPHYVLQMFDISSGAVAHATIPHLRTGNIQCQVVLVEPVRALRRAGMFHSQVKRPLLCGSAICFTSRSFHLLVQADGLEVPHPS
jgi:hypothetical protein